MFNKVILTFTTRIATALLSVVNVLIGTNYLGVEGFGTISLVILGITIYLMIQNIVAGSSVVYFISKFQPTSILILCYSWFFISLTGYSLIVFSTQQLADIFHWSFELVPKEHAWHNIFLAGSYGLMNIHLNLLLGKEKIKSYNLIFFAQHITLTVMLVYFFVFLKFKTLSYYLISMYISYLFSYLFALTLSLRYLKDFSLPSYSQFRAMLKYGILGQMANIFQLLNYRLSYYLIDVFLGRATLGIFSAATQLCEGLWIFGKSIATVQFARISNSDDREYSRKLSLRLMKFTLFVTLFPLLVLMFLPPVFYIHFLGQSFELVPSTIRWLSLGTLALSSSVIMSHYYSGTGRIVMNTYGSGIGMIVTLILGFAVIPSFGLKGAGLVTSISYISSFIFLLFQFNREEKIQLKDVILNKNDIIESWNLLTSMVHRK